MQENRNIEDILSSHDVDIDDSYFVNNFGVTGPENKTAPLIRQYKTNLALAVMQNNIEGLLDLQKAQKAVEIGESSIGLSQVLKAINSLKTDLNSRFDDVDQKYSQLAAVIDNIRDDMTNISNSMEERFNSMEERCNSMEEISIKN